jgi:hypothetical protein
VTTAKFLSIATNVVTSFVTITIALLTVNLANRAIVVHVDEGRQVVICAA